MVPNREKQLIAISGWAASRAALFHQTEWDTEAMGQLPGLPKMLRLLGLRANLFIHPIIIQTSHSSCL